MFYDSKSSGGKGQGNALPTNWAPSQQRLSRKRLMIPRMQVRMGAAINRTDMISEGERKNRERSILSGCIWVFGSE